MESKLTWLQHALTSLIGAIIATGAVYLVVPGPEQKYALAAIGILAYLLGVRTPTPGTVSLPKELAPYARNPPSRPSKPVELP